ncbi:hypothetical protein LTR78_007163 [Recurvomyces mirabilis]|uniref:Uncharacterized protein n=2 Tax=Recurvomyces mirabilis TaxID=574656 RepID=A0AAE1BZ02_9PEZI|nr:hypothetical protein LTR78_007163 [Recurvomyces mirabilis]
MPTALVVRRRFLSPPWSSLSRIHSRCQSSTSNSNDRRNIRPKQRRSEHERDGGTKSKGGAEPKKKPSLMEQLFPEETKKHDEAEQNATREIPRLPLEKPATTIRRQRSFSPLSGESTVSSGTARGRHLETRYRQQDDQGEQPTVLVLRNASKNLLEEDFRRIVPQGQHMEGWTLEQGDILKIVPGRNLATLEQENFYYLLFSNKLSAFTYQGHATRISRMAASQTPSSLSSPLAPPPGYMIDGIDAHAAIESFSLVPALQQMELRQLQPPLTPMMETIVRHQGYKALVRRPDKVPFEVRLTMDGPQLGRSSIRRILLATAEDRALGWSGGDEKLPKIQEWTPAKQASPHDRHGTRARVMAAALERTEEEQMEIDLAKEARKARSQSAGQSVDIGAESTKQLGRRTPGLVYVVGFHTEMAAQQFVRFWHRRPLSWKQEHAAEWEDDLPPVANAEMLW